MRLARVLAAAAVAAGSLALATPASAGPFCDRFPEQCAYDCVTSPCTPDDWYYYVVDRLPVDGGS